MAETGAIKAGGAFVEISTRNAGFLKGLNAASAKLKAWGAAVVGIGTKIAAAGAAASGVLLSTLKVFADQGDALAKMSQRTGISVESLSELGYAAGQSGASLEVLEKAVRKMQQGLTEAGDEGGTMAEAFTRLGLSVADLQAMNPEQQFTAIAEKLSQVQDPTLKAAIAMDLFGKSGTQLLPMLADGVEGVDALRQRARDLGLTMSTEAANGAVVFGDNLADVWLQVKKVAFEVGASLAPALMKMLKALQSGLARAIEWVKTNRDMITGALKMTAAVTAAGVAIVGIGLALKAAGIAAGIMASAIVAATTVFAAAKAAVLLLLTPVGALSAAAVALGVVIVKQSNIINDVLGWLEGAFASLWEEAKTTFDAIKAALSGGEVGKAAAVFWAFIKLEWQKGINALSEFWFTFSQGFMESWRDTVTMFAKLFITGVGLIKIAWANVVEFIAAAWTNASAKVESLWSRLQEKVENTIHDLSGGTAEERETLKQLSSQAHNKDREDIENQKANRLAEIASDAEKARQDAVAGVNTQFDLMDQEAKAAEQARIKAMNDRVNGTSEELAKAQQEFRDAVNAAKEAGNKAAVDATTGARRAGYVSPSEDDGLIGQLRSMSTKGIFNPRAIQSLQGNRTENRWQRGLEKAIEKMVGGQDEAVDVLKKIERKEGMAFA